MKFYFYIVLGAGTSILQAQRLESMCLDRSVSGCSTLSAGADLVRWNDGFSLLSRGCFSTAR